MPGLPALNFTEFPSFFGGGGGIVVVFVALHEEVSLISAVFCFFGLGRRWTKMSALVVLVSCSGVTLFRKGTF